MADNKELKRLSRSELLELLIAQTKKNEKLTEQLNEAKQKLEDRSMAVAEAGSLAEASLQVGGVFEAAQQAIDLYRENVTARCRQEEKDAKKHALAYVRKALTVLSSAAQTIEHAGGDASEVRRLAQELIGKYGKKSAEHAGEADALAESTPESTPQTETEAAEKSRSRPDKRYHSTVYKGDRSLNTYSANFYILRQTRRKTVTQSYTAC